MIKQLSRLEFHFPDDIIITDNKKPPTFLHFPSFLLSSFSFLVGIETNICEPKYWYY